MNKRDAKKFGRIVEAQYVGTEDVCWLCNKLRVVDAKATEQEATIAKLRGVLAAAAKDLAGTTDARAVMVHAGINIVLVAVPS